MGHKAATYCMTKVPFGHSMIDMALSIEDSSRTGELLMKVCLIGLAVVYDRYQVRIVEGKVVGSTSYDGAYSADTGRQ